MPPAITRSTLNPHPMKVKCKCGVEFDTDIKWLIPIEYKCDKCQQP